jgi:adenosylhomocysteinase
VRPNVDEIRLPNGRKVYLIGKGRLANLAAAEGHPPEVMQMSFADQFLAAIKLHTDHKAMENRVYGVSHEMDDEVARAALKSLGISIGTPTKEQLEYAKSWKL